MQPKCTWARRPRSASGASARWALALACFGVGQCAWAQAPPLPPATDPGRVQERFEREAPPADPARLPELRGGEREPPPGLPSSVTFQLREIRIEGDSVLPVEPWHALAAEYIGRRISGADVFELARRLTAVYRNAGYILSQVVVPPQSLADGTLTLHVVEGYIAEVQVRGDAGVRETLEALGEKIKASRPLYAAVLERYLLIANDLPGVRLRSVLAPSRTPGAADLILIAEVQKVEGFASLDNYGSRFLGPGQLTAAVTGNRPFGANGALQATGVTSEDGELGYVQLGYAQILNLEGLKLGAKVSQARTRPGDVLEPFDVRGRADSLSLSLGYPFVRSRNRSLLGRIVYDHRDVETDVLGTRVIEDRIRALRLGLTAIALDALNGYNTLDLEVSQGVGGTDEDDPLKSRAQADGRFTKLAFGYERFQPLAPRYGLTLALGGQWADEPLLSSEQYALGGRSFGRAYEPAEIVGDHALALRLEPVYQAGAFAGLQSVQLYGFYGVGRVWQQSAGAGEDDERSLASAGIGARLAHDRGLSAVVEIAWPLTRAIASFGDEGKEARLLGSVALRF